MTNLTRVIFDSLLVLMLLGLLVLPISSVGLLGVNGELPGQNSEVLSATDKKDDTAVVSKRVLIKDAPKDLPQTPVKESTATTQSTKSTKSNKR